MMRAIVSCGTVDFSEGRIAAIQLDGVIVNCVIGPKS